ncbi:MAG: hypothetical protein Q9219_002730 [cf. Caloplaca sp. 3 TL-2023]
MPSSKKAIRKMSKALKRSHRSRKIAFKPPNVLPAKSVADGITAYVNDSGEDNAPQPILPGGRRYSIARSLSKVFAKMAVQELPMSEEKDERSSAGVATLAPTANRYLMLDHQSLDSPPDGGISSELEEGGAICKTDDASEDMVVPLEHNLDEGTPSLTSPTDTSVRDTASRRQPQEFIDRQSISNSISARPARVSAERLLSFMGSPAPSNSDRKTVEEMTDASLKCQLVRDDVQPSSVHRQENSTNLQSVRYEDQTAEKYGTPCEKPFDRAVQRPPPKMFLKNDITAEVNHQLRTKNWVEETTNDDVSDSASLASSLSAERFTLGSPEIPLLLPSNNDIDKVELPNGLDGTSRKLSESATVPSFPKHDRAFLADADCPLMGCPDVRGVHQSIVKHPRGVSWGHHSENKSPWWNNSAPCVPAQGMFAHGKTDAPIPRVSHNVEERQQGHAALITVPPGFPRRCGLPPPDLAHRYSPTLDKATLDTYQRMRYPDWTRDARGRPDIPRPLEEHDATHLMNLYTQRFYGCNLDSARDLHFTKIPKEFNLGGLLS